MIIDSKAGARGVLVNLNTGQRIRWARWSNLETGEFEAFRMDPREAKRRGIPLAQLIYRGQARLQWIPESPKSSSTPLVPVQAPAQGPLFTRHAERCLILADRPCEAYGCSRLAEWKVADEEPLPPEVGPDGQRYERARTVAVHWWCSFHYQAPRLLDAKGEVIERYEEIKARPS